MRTVFLFLSAVIILPAHAEPVADRERAVAMQRQAQQQARIERAQARCNANRGADCDTLEGLNEWLLLDRSRQDAVLDTFPSSATSGASLPPVVTPGVPATSPKNVP